MLARLLVRILQKISDTDMINNLAVLAPRENKNLMIEQGFDPRTATVETYVEICERAETKEDGHKEIETHKNARFASDDDESDTLYKKKNRRSIIYPASTLGGIPTTK
jgi:hypothetical protein